MRGLLDLGEMGFVAPIGQAVATRQGALLIAAFDDEDD